MPKPEMVCVDASFVMRLLLGGSGGEKAEELWEQWMRNGVQAIAPGLIFYEISNAIYRLFSSSFLLFEEARETFDLALSLGIRAISEELTYRKALLLARQFGLKATYDAHYLAVAQSLETDFWTADHRLFNTVGGALPLVRFLGTSS